MIDEIFQVYNLVGAGLALTDYFMVFSAVFLIYILPVVLIYLWFKDKKSSILTFTAVLTGLVVSYIMGLIYSHPPPHLQGIDTILANDPGNAFPSDHTTVLFSAVWPLVMAKKKLLSMLVTAAAVLTALGRIYTGLHFPVDIFGAVTASLIAFGIVYLLRDFIHRCASELDRIESRIKYKIQK